MKHLVLVLLVAFPMIFSSAVQAWSPLDEFRPAIEAMQHCASIIAGSEEDQEGENNEEEEEEPDCD